MQLLKLFSQLVELFLQLVWLLGSGGAVIAAKWIFFAIRRAVLELLEPFLELVGLLYFRY